MEKTLITEKALTKAFERKLKIVSGNYADEYLRQNEKAIKKMIKDAYIEGFNEGVRKMQETINYENKSKEKK